MKADRFLQVLFVLLVGTMGAIVWVIPPNSAFASRFLEGLRTLGLGGSTVLFVIAAMRRLWPFVFIGLGLLLSMYDPMLHWLAVLGDATIVAGALLLMHKTKMQTHS